MNDRKYVSAPRWKVALNLAAFIAAVVAIGAAVSSFAQRPEMRLTLDATKTRAYSLSDQTRRLLEQLDGEWTIAMIMVESGQDGATVRQVDEVLSRYRAASRAIRVVRVDPTDPATLPAYDALLARLRETEGGLITDYDTALDAGVAEFGELLLFAQRQAAGLERVVERVGAETSREVQQRVGLLGLLADEGKQVLDLVAEYRTESEARPIPDYEGARSVLASALSQWADELFELAQLHGRWRSDAAGDVALARYAATAQDEYQAMAQTLAAAADPLEQLPPLEIASIGRQLAGGEVGIVVGPDSAAVIPTQQLFPDLNLGDIGRGRVAFDRRFRGEQVISAAIRSLLVPHLPMVVFVHAEDGSLMRERPQRADLLGVSTLLDGSRFDVREWRIDGGQRPIPDAGQPVVYCVIPPIQRHGLDPSDAERELVRTVDGLIADGESVLLDFFPSHMPKLRQTDPWAHVPAPFGIVPDTANVIYEAVALGDDRHEYQRGQVVRDFTATHPIAQAVHGQQCYFVLPVPLAPADAPAPDIDITVLGEVEPSADRWIEPDWLTKQSVDRSTGGRVERGDSLPGPVPLVVAVERDNPVTAGRQRAIIVGSGGWMLSSAADALTPIGGDRAALTNPGNQELLLASIAWLAGMDELIAPSPVSRQVARLDGIDGGVSVRWALLSVAGIPLLCLGLGAAVWFTRR